MSYLDLRVKEIEEKMLSALINGNEKDYKKYKDQLLQIKKMKEFLQ